MACTLGRWPTAEELAEACDLSEQQVNEAAQLARTGDPRSLDEKSESGDSDEGLALSESIGGEDRSFDRSLDRLTLATALDTLPQREKTILNLRFYDEMSQRQIAERIHVSQMHVSRLERGALRKRRLVLQSSADALGAPGREAVPYDAELSVAS